MPEKRKDKLLLGMFFTATFLLRIFYITKVEGPFIYADEMGYWGHAANLTGNSWAGVMNGMPWYAFGYSLFLTPLFWISNDIVVMYRLAVVINIVFGLLCFYLAYQTVQKISGDSLNTLQAGTFAFAATSYSACIFNSYIGWSETLLSLLIWLILYEFILLEEKPDCLKGILLGVMAGFGYMVHNRMLAVIAAVFLVSIFSVWRKKMKLTHLLCMAASVFVLFFLFSITKDYFRGMMTDNAVLRNLGMETELNKTNTLSDQILKMQSIFSLTGIKQFFLNMAGQIWETLSGTYLLAGLGVVFCIKKALTAVKEDKNAGVYLFPVFALICSMTVTSLFFIKNAINISESKVRIDKIFFGRYNGIMLAPLIVMGLMLLYEEIKTDWKYILTVYLIYFIVSVMMYFGLKDIDNFYLNVVSAVGIHIFHWLGEFAVWKCVLMAVAVSVVYLICSFVRLPKKAGSYLICLMLVFLFSTTALKCMRSSIRGENDYIKQYQEIFDFLNENTEKKELIYTLSKEKAAYDLQTRVVDKMVISIDGSQIALAGSAYIVMPMQDYETLTDSEYEVCLQAKDYAVVRKTGD